MESTSIVRSAAVIFPQCAKCARQMDSASICAECGQCKLCSPRLGIIQTAKGIAGMCAKCARVNDHCDKCARIGEMLWPCHCEMCGTIIPGAHIVCFQCHCCEKCSAHAHGSSYCIKCRDGIFACVGAATIGSATVGPATVDVAPRVSTTIASRPIPCNNSRISEIQEKREKLKKLRVFQLYTIAHLSNIILSRSEKRVAVAIEVLARNKKCTLEIIEGMTSRHKYY